MIHGQIVSVNFAGAEMAVQNFKLSMERASEACRKFSSTYARSIEATGMFDICMKSRRNGRDHKSRIVKKKMKKFFEKLERETQNEQ